MATEVIMPQMGESIAEGTITKWLKKVGDPVKRDEPIFEISTDKVDAEIPAPAAGTLLEIKAQEGQTVPINTVVAVIGEAGEKGVEAPPAGKPAEEKTQPAAAPPSPAREAAKAAQAPPKEEPRRARSLPARASSPSRSGSGCAPRLSCGRSPRSTEWISPTSRARASTTG